MGVRGTEHKRDSGAALGQGPGCKKSNGLQAPWDWSQSTWCPVGTVAQNDPAKFPSTVSVYPSNYGSGLGGAFPAGIWYYTPAQLAEFNKYSNRDNDGSRLDYSTQFALKENVNAFYVQSNMEGQGWSGNFGLRVVQTKEKVTSALTGPGKNQAESAFGTFHFETTENTYNDVLPSLNLRFDVQKDLVARFAASKTMTRPDFGALASAISLSPPSTATGIGSGSGANPNLKPIRSNNLDVSLEYYYAPRALLSGSVYYMDLTSYVGIGQVTRSYFTTSSAIPQGAMVPYVLSVPVNSSAKVKGFELAWEQPILNNFGVAANYTYADAKDAKDQEVVGASKNTYNLSGYYEDDTFNARLSYSYRSAFYSGLDRETAFSQAATGSLSASFGYKINENFALSLDAHNLNNPKLKYFALNNDQPRSIYQSGRQYYLTLRVKM